MRKETLRAALVIAAFAGLCSTAPGGPGDADPEQGPPYAIIHCPATISVSSDTCDIWVHGCNMWNGETSTLSVNHNAVVIVTFVQTPDATPANGAWDDHYTIKTPAIAAGHYAYWSTVVTKADDHATYSATARSLMTSP
jgi:hypothetical protein